MSVEKRSRNGKTTWRVHWRDDGRQRTKSFDKERLAVRYDARIKADPSRRKPARPPDGGLDVRGFYVYTLWGNDPERPLYVGQPVNVMRRLNSHLSGRFAELVQRVSFVRCRDKQELDRVEAEMIRTLAPTENRVVRLISGAS